ncbi:hypothetical protein CTZ24_20755 (plasmid) [Pantoea phytobeneficialis]|uniref:Uncharacterized protein n=2 Tax=Pantoea phytobeneficialis TaxID=2052056 RepID=A0AAP9KRC7_9GAMM|nr:hypothetical protein CTZ24_20755 [Pantoea phytobeneficialis]
MFAMSTVVMIFLGVNGLWLLQGKEVCVSLGFLCAPACKSYKNHCVSTMIKSLRSCKDVVYIGIVFYTARCKTE